jgi:hypothetical protein
MKRRFAAIFALALLSKDASAQTLIEATEELDFDRPESWAMKYYASLALLTGMGVPEALGAGRVDLGFEGGFVPQLSEDERRVGFGGIKVEDLNRTPFFGRVRGRVGLSGSASLEVAYLPPIEVDGATPHMFSVALARAFDAGDRWKIGLRGYGHFGSIEGDITCSSEDLKGSNPFDCAELSNDHLSQRAFGVEVTTGYFSGGPIRPHAGFALNYLDLAFQVASTYSGIRDRTLQLTDGVTFYLTGGATYAPGEKWRVTGEILYSRLQVVRPPATESENDPLVNFRFLVTYRIR